MKEKNTGITPELTGREIGNKNLKEPWKPGESGNQDGRPVGSKNGIRAHLKRLLNSTAPEKWKKAIKKKGFDCDSGEIAEVFASKLIITAIEKNNSHSQKMILDQTEEALPKAINLAGGDGGPLEVIINNHFPIADVDHGDGDGDDDE